MKSHQLIGRNFVFKEEFDNTKPRTKIIQPTGKISFKSIQEVFNYRELLYFFMWRDWKLRYRQTAIGVIWTVLQPLVTMVIFSLFFGRIAKFSTGETPYALFAFAGLLPWIFFSKGVLQAANVLIDDAEMIRKIYFPRIILPTADICVNFLDLGISLICLLFLMPLYSYSFSWSILFLPFAIIHLVTLSLGVSYWLSALNALYRDVRHTMPFIMQFLLFASPVIYPAHFFEKVVGKAYMLNPLVGVISHFRYAILGELFLPNLYEVSFSYGISLLLFVTGYYYFKKIELIVADVV